MKTNQFKKKTALVVFLLAIFICSDVIAQQTVKASDIIQDIKNGKNISYENVTIIGDLDMTFMDEKLPALPRKHRWYKNGGSNSIEEQIEGKIAFVNCIFEDNVYAYFHDKDSKYTFVANFENDVKFVDCTFKEDALFKYSDFERNATFSGSKFNKKTTFKYAKFDENVNFSNATFNKSAIFKYSNFRNGVSFNDTAFKDCLDIKYVKIRGDFDTTNMSVTNNIDSKYSDINGDGFSKHLLSRKN
jgi:hypothetical protein